MSTVFSFMMQFFSMHTARFLGVMVALSLGSCGVLPGKKTFNQPVSLEDTVPLSEATAADTLSKPSLETTPDFLAEGKAEVKQEKKKKKKKPKVFEGYKIKRGYARSGRKGKNQIIETFYYLKEYQEPNAFVPDRYFFDLKDRKLKRTRGTINPGRARILHGPYKKTQGGKVIEEGFFYVGTRHLRWERYNKDNILLSKIHYEKGFPRDATVQYYDAERQKVKEVIPVYMGEVEGQYLRFYENGQLEWQGQYEKGKKVGVWIKFYSFRQRRHYEYQYPKSCYDPPFEPVLIKEYNRSGKLVYEKGKLDNRAQR